MKPQSSCLSCRQRHRKCITRPGATKCNECDQLNQDCDSSPKFQFRITKHGDSGGRRKSNEGSSRAAGIGSISRGNRNDGARLGNLSSSPPDLQTGQEEVASHQNSQKVPASTHPSQGTNIGILPDCISSDSPVVEGWAVAASSPFLSDGTGLSPTRSGALEPPRCSPALGLTQREAYLFRTWIDRLSLVSDATDEARHFGVVIPKLAMDHPLIMNGILALASRVDFVTGGTGSDIESAYYHGQCIEHLIESLSKPPETYDSKLLAAVVISRLYEENDTETDALTYHLRGTRTLLSTEVITRIAREGGLAEAACWVHLRQAIYVAIVHRQPPDIPLEVYDSLDTSHKTSDSSYANGVVYIFAQILRSYFSTDEDQLGTQVNSSWTQLETRLDIWLRSKPSSFDPFFYEPADSDAGKPFPSWWLVSGIPTVALEYYYSSMIILCLRKHNQITSHNGFEAARERKINENSIASYLCILMGLAQSNGSELNLWYLPCHMLNLCGYCLRNPVQRSHTLTYLETAKSKVQWKTASTIKMLKEHWAELDSYEG